jgi:hypothetical protein
MARYPRAVYREVTGLQNDPPIEPIGMIAHVSASQAPSLFGWFNGPSKGIESHLHLPYEATTPAEQYRDTTREADANYRANSWVDGLLGRVGMVSVETQGLGYGAWTDHQVAELVTVGLWLQEVHPRIPAKRATSAYSGGFGYHVQYPEWSNVPGKICPGPIRIQQWNDLVLPGILRQLTVPLPPSGPIIVQAPPPIVAPGVPAPAFPLPAGYYFGPKEGPAQSVSGYYSHRDDLRLWQNRMGQRGWSIGADGLYGPNTADVARSFQAEKHLLADGLIGPVTWTAAWTAPTTT